MKYFLGIDPGVSGAFALLSEDMADLEIWLFPDTLSELVDIFDDLLEIEGNEIVMCALEEQRAAGFQGASKTFTHGNNYGQWEAALAFMRLPHVVIAPSKWQYAIFDGIKRKDDTKLVSLANATRKFPGAGIGKNHNKADAVNLALFARKVFLEG